MNPIQFYIKLLHKPRIKWLVMALTLVYVFSPIDIIPDFILPFGFIDDGALLILMITQLVLGFRRPR
jgi:uncharacterized membrane protein YkvA (DUF1232 family)